MTTPGWDAAYAASEPAPRDIGRPQAAFVRLADKGLLHGRLLDSGGGMGEQTLLAASHGGSTSLTTPTALGTSPAWPRCSAMAVPATFSDGWSITSIEAAEFERDQSGPGIPFAQAWLAAIQRIKRAIGVQGGGRVHVRLDQRSQSLSLDVSQGGCV